MNRQDMRDEEVLRANKELTAYFKGQRTEREARAALKIIKAFVRDRERTDAKALAPLPGLKIAKAPIAVAKRKAAGNEQTRSKPRRHIRKKSKAATGSTESRVTTNVPLAPASDEPTS